MAVDILAFGAHPDDVELSCAGTLAAQVAQGYSCAVVDLTKGDLGTRGTVEIRMQEAAAAAQILGLAHRENLGFADGFFRNDREHQLAVIRMIRKYRPQIVLANAPSDRHPDHGRAALLVRETCFLAGLRQISTEHDGVKQEAYRPQQVFYYIQFQNHTPDFIMDISEYMELKLSAIKAYKSQFYQEDSDEPKTVISSKGFMQSIEYRAQDMGRLIGVDYGEGFLKSQDLGLSDIMAFQGVR